MNKKTALYEEHIISGAFLVNFYNWILPLYYSSQINEHYAVRKDVGMFDISHMTIIDIEGAQSGIYLRYLLTKDVFQIIPGKALYSTILNENAGIIDDVVVYSLSSSLFRIIANASTRDRVINWMSHHKMNYPTVKVKLRDDLSLIAVQGPNSLLKLHHIFGKDYHYLFKKLERFCCMEINDFFFSTTGYTGEIGYEIALPNCKAIDFWRHLKTLGIETCGLGARNTLRLEAGMNLYNQDMDEHTSPFSTNMSHTISWYPASRKFIGRTALEKLKDNTDEKMVGILMVSEGVVRNGLKIYYRDIYGKEGEGIVTSGTFSPTLKRGIGLARVSRYIGNFAYAKLYNREVCLKVMAPNFIHCSD